jgi:hypothetical protein
VPQPLQPRASPLLEALADDAIALGATPFDPILPSFLGALPLESLALEPLRDRPPPTPQRDYLALAPAEATRRSRLTVRLLIGDAIVPREPHAAGGLAASEAL